MDEMISMAVSMVVVGGFFLLLLSPLLLFAYILGKAHEGDVWLAEHGMKGYENWKNFNTKK